MWLVGKTYSHITDSCHACGTDGVDARTEVFDNSASSALDGQDTSDLQNDICITSAIAAVREFILVTLW